MGGILPLCRGAVGVFYSPSRLGNLFVDPDANNPVNPNMLMETIPKKDLNLDDLLDNDYSQKLRQYQQNCLFPSFYEGRKILVTFLTTKSISLS